MLGWDHSSLQGNIKVWNICNCDSNNSFCKHSKKNPLVVENSLLSNRKTSSLWNCNVSILHLNYCYKESCLSHLPSFSWIAKVHLWIIRTFHPWNIKPFSVHLWIIKSAFSPVDRIELVVKQSEIYPSIFFSYLINQSHFTTNVTIWIASTWTVKRIIFIFK